VDDNGHNFGPLSPENRQAVMKVDNSLGRFFEGLEKRGIADLVNIILVSDHGMSPYTNRGAIVLDEMFDPNDAERIFWTGEFTQIFPKSGREDAIYDSIKKKLRNAKIYRKADLPKRWRLQNASRLSPLIVVPEEGRFITSRSRLDRYVKQSGFDKERGAHGFDNRLVNMRAFFAARGPRFEKGRTAGKIRSVDVYNVMCEILGVRPAANDGDRRVVKKLLR
ncbi:MAG: alkaline phosphatase family protein, partial [Pyrinomonadaceae bacterium]|nr:alkaline phosphatase family protein [Pyrinomonadaceae bacterium]